MACLHTEWLTNREHRDRFAAKIEAHRVPLIGSLELTSACNFRCVHCYVDRKECGSEELSTARWQTIIDDITAAGCLFLLLTGGDPLLRKDFREIYSRARQNGLIVTVFTNGTNLTPEILATFRQYPPRLVEITLYGATERTYARITGSENGLSACRQGIESLLAQGVPTGLKTVLMTLNHEEFAAMEAMAAGYGVNFRYDPALFPRFNGDRSPLRLRVSPEEVSRIDFAGSARAEEWRTVYNLTQKGIIGDKLYQCGSGVNSFHITAGGRLQPCLLVNDLQYDLAGGSFLEGWAQVMPGIRKRQASADNKCLGCDRMALCSYCPPFSRLETGNENHCSEYLCQLAEYRIKGIHDTAS